MARKIILTLGLILFVGGGLLWWRLSHPPLTDEQQIAANLEDIRGTLESGGVERIMGYLSEDAKFQGEGRSQIRSYLQMGLYEGLRRRDVRVVFTNVANEVKGDTATSSGHYKVDARMGRSGTQSSDGDFTLTWKKLDGVWKITNGSTKGELPTQ